MTLLYLSKLTSGYSGTIIVRDIELEVEKGSIVCLLGRNGVGKSTLLKTIIGEIRKMSGEIKFENNDISKKKSFEIAKLGISYAAQEMAIFSSLTVEENLKLGQKLDDNYYSILEKLYNYFPILKERSPQQAGNLSGGEKKMLLLSRTILTSPKLILLDEITEGVQPSMIDKFQEVLMDLNKEKGTTVFLAEQNLDFATAISNKYAVMNQGMIIETGEVKSNTRTNVQKYLTL